MTRQQEGDEAAKRAADGLPERVWIASYVASDYAGVLARGLRFRSIHNSKEDAEGMQRDPQAIGFTFSEYAKLPTPEDETTLPALPKSVLMRMRNHSRTNCHEDATREALYGRERQLIAALRERDALTKIVKSGSFYPAYEAQKVRAEKSEAERDALKAERDAIAKNVFGLREIINIYASDVSTLKAKLDAVVGQETPQEAFRRGQDVMRKECARLFDDAIKWGHPDGSLKNTYVAPYMPPLKAGQ